MVKKKSNKQIIILFVNYSVKYTIKKTCYKSTDISKLKNIQMHLYST